MSAQTKPSYPELLAASGSPNVAALLESLQSPPALTDAESAELKLFDDELRRLQAEENEAELKTMAELAPLERAAALLMAERARLAAKHGGDCLPEHNHALELLTARLRTLDEENSLLLLKADIQRRKELIHTRMKEHLAGMAARRVDPAVATFNASVVPASA